MIEDKLSTEVPAVVESRFSDPSVKTFLIGNRMAVRGRSVPEAVKPFRKARVERRGVRMPV